MIEQAFNMSDSVYIMQLKEKLREAEETLDAIRTGAVDALFMEGEDGVSVYTLESADRPYRTLIEQMQEGAVSMSFDGTIIYANKRLGEILHCPLEQVIGQKFERFVTPADLSRFRNFLIVSATSDVREDFMLQSLDGGNFPVYLSFRTLVDVPYDSSITCGVVTDLTKQRQMEARLSQAQKMEAVGQLTGGLAHDFNNLLQGINGSFDLIIRISDSPRVQKWAQAGLKAADRGGKLTAQLLAFSRLQKLEAKPLQINDIVNGMSELLKRTLGPSIRFKLDLWKAEHWVLSDATQLELAALNLCLNARDAMVKGGTLTITTRHLPAVGASAELGAMEMCVSDSGCGMEIEVSEQAFGPFFTTKGIGAGTGLGLAQVQTTVEQSGGSVRVESLPDVGTQVYLTIPCTDKRTASPRAVTLKAKRSPTAPKKIILIDDDLDVRTIITDMVSVLGHEVESFDDGALGLDQIARQVPDLVLLDFAMPNMNGAEVATAIRAKHASLPIIFISGFADSEQLTSAVGADATILRKPFTIEQLKRLIASAVS